MHIWWILGGHFLCCLLVAAYDDHKKCLNIPEVYPKKYFFFKGKSQMIKLDTSSRVTHQLNTQIFYIYLKEYLGYPKIEINTFEDNFQVEPVVERLSDYYNSAVSEPVATINLEVWVRPDYDAAMSQFVIEGGTVAPPGRFSWFIPADLDKPVKAYYAKHRQAENIQEVHWSLFIDPVMVEPFDISNTLLTNVLDRHAKVKVNGVEQYNCNNASYCNNGMHTPERCKEQVCAILLAPQYAVSSFLIDQIDEMKLLVKVLWLGDNLKEAIYELTNLYRLERTTQSLLFFYWYPSDIVIDQRNFISVVFTNNEIMDFTKNEDVGYKYEMHRLVKLAWGKIEEYAKPLYESLTKFKLEEEDYVYMLKIHREYPTKSMREIACEWMLYNNRTWATWKKDYRMELYIGGIFPMYATSYNGRGIVGGSYMAIDAINRNKTILADYTLRMLVQDGKCEADTVMKHFIDFIVEGYYSKLIGVLGPACSETVEPLAGVSRHYHIMAISYSAEGTSFSDRTKYPYFFRTIGENKHYKYVYLYLLKYFGWKRVAALTEDGQKYTEYISLMQDDLEKNNIKFIANKKFPREREAEAMTRYLEDLKNKRARIIIADVVDDVARAVMCEAYKLEMTSAQGYVWFFPIWLNATWYNTDYFNLNKTENVKCTTQEMIKAITGYFTMTHAYFAPGDSIMQENITVDQWRANYNRRTKIVGPSNYAGFAYDAVWTYALALDQLAKTDSEALSDLHSENTTNKLIRLVEETDFYGVSGRIKFRGGPSRFSVINVMQWYNRSLNIIGHFYPNLSDDKPEIQGGDLKLNITAIKWFTPDRKTPEDGTEPPDTCGVEYLANSLGSTCQTAWLVLNLTVGSILVIIGVVFCLLMKRKYERKVQQTKNYIKALGLTFDLYNTSDLDKWEISRESVVINRKLGEGAFGTVYGGEANLLDTGWCAVAVKTLKMGSTTEETLDFLSEAEVMKRFEHKNIVKLLGVCTKDEPIYTIMEFMLYGDLKTYLLARRNLVGKNTEEAEEVSSKRLTSMALDVARGLSYLAEMKYVHRDIASRNCLVNAQRSVKLGDFGMTRAMFENDYYKFTRKGMLPVRWMSPESLELGKFTTYSDVWSYGVLLYEIITFGSFPFQGKSNSQVLELVKAGHTVEIPKGVKVQLEGLIKSCWNLEYTKRPSASEIVDHLANNPRLLTPCLDIPLSSVQVESGDPTELNVPTEFRKFTTTSKSSPSKPSYSIPMQQLSPFHQAPEERSDSESIPMEQMSVKEPLLGDRPSKAE